MSKTLSNILTVFKVAKIISKVVFILSIVGAVGCLLGFVGISAVKGFMSDVMVVDGMDGYSAVFKSISGIIACIGSAIFAFLAEKYFKNVLKAGTPFTFEGAKECFDLGIASLIISAASSVMLGIISGIAVLIPESNSVNLDFNLSVSVSTGLFFMFLSIVFKYGAELQKASEYKAEQGAQNFDIEDR